MQTSLKSRAAPHQQQTQRRNIGEFSDHLKLPFSSLLSRGKLELRGHCTVMLYSVCCLIHLVLDSAVIKDMLVYLRLRAEAGCDNWRSPAGNRLERVKSINNCGIPQKADANSLGSGSEFKCLYKGFGLASKYRRLKPNVSIKCYSIILNTIASSVNIQSRAQWRRRGGPYPV